ncbi:MAG: hypothetical protein K6G28_01055 [Acholeplasmatales bacterium]|nr:hypothetical protein [Acholeplasmatales bacterium]
MDEKETIDAEVINEKENEQQYSQNVINSTDDFVKMVDSWPIWLKLILCIPSVHLFWGIYRILKYSKDTTKLVISLVFIIIPIMWLIDLIFVLTKGHVLLFEEN